VTVAVALAVMVVASLAACAGKPPSGRPDPQPRGPTAVTRPADRDALAALAAAAKDRRYVARYAFVPAASAGAGNAGPRELTVTVAVATDGSWVVAVPAGAMGGLADVAMFRSGDGLFQCALGPAAGTAGTRPDLPPVTPGCVEVNGLAPAIDPRVQHVFTDWIDAFVDRATALSVASAPLLAGARGQCYSVEPISAALAPPVDPGIYCYDGDGVLTAVRVGFGTMTLIGPVQPAPPAVAQPAPTVTRAALAMTPPPPPPAASPSAS
jgi:hypothetical protein